MVSACSEYDPHRPSGRAHIHLLHSTRSPYELCLTLMPRETNLAETYLRYAASALSENTIIHNFEGALYPLFSTQMLVNLGINWASTLLGCFALILASMPFLFYKFGKRIRSKGHFSLCIDLKVAKFLEENKLVTSKQASECGGEKPETV